MTNEEKAKRYDEAIKKLRDLHDNYDEISNLVNFKQEIEEIFPELKESEDERIRKFLVKHVSEWIGCIEHDLKISSKDVESEEELAMFKASLAYLEKQKEPFPIPDKFSGLKSLMLQYLQSAANRKDDSEIESDTNLWGRKILDYVWKYDDMQKDASKAIDAVDRIDKYIDEHVANAHDMKDSNPDKKYYRGWDDALGKMAGILQDVYSEEKQKEQKPIKMEVYEVGKGTTVCGQDYKCKKDYKVGNCWYIKDAIYHCGRDGYLTDQNGVSWSCTPKWFNEYIYTNNELADKEKSDFVSGQFLQCKLSFDEFKEGKHYWLEYIGDDMYVGRSDNILNQKFHITPRQLYSLFSQQLEEKQKEQKPKQVPKWLYRLEFKDNSCGLWYNGQGEWCFENGIGSLDDSCKTKNLPMDYDERYKQDGRNWFSSCSKKEDLLHWYSKEDAKTLLNKGFVFTRYLATEYHEYDQQTVFIKETALYREEINFIELMKEQKPAEWSDEDADMLNCCISSIEEAKENRYAYKETDGDTSYDREIDWLNSLRPQPHTVSIKNATKFGNLEYERGVKDGIQSEKSRQWKPSEEQMDALRASNSYWKGTTNEVPRTDLLESLYNDLEKLIAKR